MFTLSTEQDIKDFTIGCCFFGTGGGGNPEFGQKMLMDVLTAGKQINIIDINELNDEAWIVCPYLMGTSGPETEEVRAAKQKYALTKETVANMPTAATKLLLQESKTTVQLSAIIPYEIGGAATSSAVATAAWLNVPVIDTDFVGRSVPEATQMLPAIYGMDLCPTASSDAFGNETIIYKTINRHITERIGKYLASASFGLIGQATLLRPAKQLKSFMLGKTLSNALKVGQTLRMHSGNTSNLKTALNQLIKSQVIFEGVISEFSGHDEEGYYVGEIIISGADNTTLKIWFKNENHIAWLNGVALLTSPDLISLVDQLTHTSYVNNQLKIGLNVIVFGTPCHSEWHKEKALQAQNPRYYGFDFDAKLLS
jgi:DUF917 family protein